MKNKYTRKQLVEAIQYWQNQLNETSTLNLSKNGSLRNIKDAVESVMMHIDFAVDGSDDVTPLDKSQIKYFLTAQNILSDVATALNKIIGNN